ncbi:MAG TPA: YjjI family glycine radical enzyme [Candidatus Lachnoclostridium stercorigallinarum]|uniref:YjjI family glycine radical enzyme n=1 Tax=Candidatus Lachnoclostridium stercorigallinarum TaxID=2838634 RepID=A0A9D2GI01_9FIRM|nr:YjjI family glycine radical enzyme [Candidatus Lachnoclostridium stercorigallinarum]
MPTTDMTQDIIYAITNPKVTFNQRLKDMAKIAENSVELVNYTEKSKEYFANGAMMDMFEGKSPYRTRYCLPDYELFLKQGSEFLMLEPPKDIWDAVGNLLCLYHNIPDDGGLPVYIGCLDKLLEPFVKDEAEAEKAIRFLLVHVDRTISNAFCHADLSGEDTKAGRIILKLTKEMGRPCPNMTLMWTENTPDDYMMAALDTAMAAAKPSFANDKLYRRDMGDYAVVSCYNTLPIGGCGLTLVRLNMNRLPELAESPEDLLNRVIPDAVTAVCDAIDSRCEFIIDYCHFYENTFLYREGLIKKDREHMVGMFGFVGLAECVNRMLNITDEKERFGRGERADAFGEQIMNRLKEELDKRPAKYGKYGLHAQVGVMEDTDSTPGGRIPIGDEPELPYQIMNFIKMHRHCDAGCGELFPFDDTAKKNPRYLLDILKGAFASGARYLSFYSSNSDLVRVTGYLVKKSDLEKFGREEMTLNEATVNGFGANKNLHLLDRKVRGEE